MKFFRSIRRRSDRTDSDRLTKKALWVHKDYLDESPDRVTWIEMINHLARLGWDITLLTGFRKERTVFPMMGKIRYIPSVKISYLNMLTSLIFVTCYISYKIVRREVTHIILDYASFWCSFPFDILSRLGVIKITFIVDWRTFHFGQFSQQHSFKDRFIKFSTYAGLKYSQLLHHGISVITEPMRDAIVSWVAFDPKRICIWSSGVNPDVFSPEEKDERLAEELGLLGKFVVMYHGVFTYQPNRGLAEAVRAMKFVKERNPQVVLVLLGNGPAAQHLSELRAEHDLKDNILILSPVPYQEVPRYINLCDVGVMAYPDNDYWKVNNPIKLLEYLAMEKPIIVRDMVTFRSVMNAQEGAVFIADNDPRTIADAICKAQTDVNFLQVEGRKGREIVLHRYTWAQQASKLDLFLEVGNQESDKRVSKSAPFGDSYSVSSVSKLEHEHFQQNIARQRNLESSTD